MAAEQTKLAEEQRQALLRGRAAGTGAEEAEVGLRESGGFGWLTALGFLFLTFNSGMAIYRSNGDPAAVGFVAFSYIDLVLLFCCLRWFENAAPGSPARGKLKVAVWVLTTLLTIVFSYKVATIMPMAVQILVWGMAAATVLGGFYAFFLHREGKVSSSNCHGRPRSRFALCNPAPPSQPFPPSPSSLPISSKVILSFSHMHLPGGLASSFVLG
ncbi:hypothetical protein HU200_063074 [Digitaria exilis]|uniref:Uncharacterized protein n=1 Tax=Digitaria exilis TaxID=1010633 RepID=A0A835DWS1_9POAL|nr:hypothetical protein HU200_063074 [Digitaria exilis]